MNMLKKASSLKNGSLKQKQVQHQQQQSGQSMPPQQSVDPNRLANQFNTTSLESPAGSILMNENSSDFQAFDMDQYPQPQSNQSVNALSGPRIITASVGSNKPASNRNDDLNDSLDMLE